MKNWALKSARFFRFYNRFRRGKYQRVEIAPLSSQVKLCIQLLPASTSKVFFPRFENDSEKINELLVRTPVVGLYHLPCAVMAINAANFYINQKLLVETLPDVPFELADYSGGIVRIHNEQVAILRNFPNIQNISGKSLILSGNGAFNYYHWLIEILPKILLLSKEELNKMEIQQIVVGSFVKNCPSFLDSFRLVLDSLDIHIPVVYVGSSEVIYFEDAYYVNSPNAVLLNSLDGSVKAAYCYFSPDLLGSFSAKLREMIKEFSFPHRRIFLVRKPESLGHYNRRRYNESEILDIFRHYGFVPVVMEDFSFLEQIYIFSQATHIAGPSGAFWANIIFCSPGAKAVSWLVSEAKEFSVYSSLAKYFDCDMRFLEAKADQPGELHGPYDLDRRETEQACRILACEGFFA